jgi:hypothetical protein
MQGVSLVADGNETRPKATGPARPVTGATAKFPRRPDPRVLSTSIPLFFIGRNKHGFWVVRAAEGRAGGIFLLKRSALRFAARNSAPAGCATMFLSERFELDVENQGDVLAAGLDAMIRVITAPVPPPAPVIASRRPPRHRRAA